MHAFWVKQEKLLKKALAHEILAKYAKQRH